jgi:hypothetical protein
MDAWSDGPVDAWPDQGIGIWPKSQTSEPLLPPLPLSAPAGAALGWVLEWPVAWMGDAAIDSWGHWAARPRPRPRHPVRRSLRPRAYRAYGYAPAYRRRRGGNALVALAALTLVSVFAILTVGPSFPAVAAQLDALRDGASNLTGGLGAAPDTPDTPTPTAIAAPALGSDAQAFAALYGARPPDAGAAAHYQTTISDLLVSLDVTIGIGADHLDRVTSVSVGASSLAGWDAATADAICGAFLPPDATLQGVTHIAADTEYRYLSASLAATFPPAYFVDDSYGPLAPGTLTRLDHPPLGSASGVGSCTLSLGAH